MKKLVIEKEKLIENIEKLQDFAKDTRIIAVLKGNGYGISLLPFAEILYEKGIRFFAVTSCEDAAALRGRFDDADILLLSEVLNLAETERMIESGIILTCGSFLSLIQCNELAQKGNLQARVHLKLDTGFGRFGFLPGQEEEIVNCIKPLSNLSVEGIYSHFSFSFASTDKFVKEQYDLFCQMTETLKKLGLSVPMRHIANSHAFLNYPFTHLDAVRIGSALLGRLSAGVPVELNRIGYLQSEVSGVKMLPKGHNIGYANTCKVKRETKIAIVNVGYQDGFMTEVKRDTFRFSDILRYLFHDAKLLLKHPACSVRINGKTAPVLGRIGMYNIICDVTDIGTVKAGDTVLLDVNTLLLDSGIEREYR